MPGSSRQAHSQQLQQADSDAKRGRGGSAAGPAEVQTDMRLAPTALCSGPAKAAARLGYSDSGCPGACRRRSQERQPAWTLERDQSI